MTTETQKFCDNCGAPLLDEQERDLGICSACEPVPLDDDFHADDNHADIPVDIQYRNAQRPATFGDFKPDPDPLEGYEDEDGWPDLDQLLKELDSELDTQAE